MNQTTAYLGLGSNLGNRQENLAQAVKGLSSGTDISVLRTSGIYDTAPWGMTGQPNFLNMVVKIYPHLSPHRLLDRAKELEIESGREPSPRFGPRLIDVDILLYGNCVVDEPDLKIPHASLHLRAFVLVPLAELAPAAVHPVVGSTIAQLADQVDGLEGVGLLG